MKSFRSFLIPAGLAVALAMPAGAMAQNAPAPAPGAPAHSGKHHHMGMKRMMQGLNLTADQQSRIQALITSFHQAHPKGSAPDAAAREALHAQIMNVLTPAQQAQFKANLAAAKAGPDRDDKNGGDEGARHGGMMQRFASLNLSDAQKTQIQNLMTQFRQAHPKGSAPDPAARQALRQQIMNVLTPQQQAQLQQEMKDENPNPPQR